MAKIPTYESKQLSGVSGVTQMPAMKRAMTQAFKKSSNIKASDFYQAAGDQAMANALGNVATLVNKIAVQKQRSDYDERIEDMRREFGLAKQEASTKGKEAYNFFQEFAKSYEGSIKSYSGSKKYKESLKSNFGSLVTEGTLATNAIVKQEIRKEADFRLKTIREGNKRDIESGVKTIDDALGDEIEFLHSNHTEGGTYTELEVIQGIKNAEEDYNKHLTEIAVYNSDSISQYENAETIIDNNPFLSPSGKKEAKSEALSILKKNQDKSFEDKNLIIQSMFAQIRRGDGIPDNFYNEIKGLATTQQDKLIIEAQLLDVSKKFISELRTADPKDYEKIYNKAINNPSLYGASVGAIEKLWKIHKDSYKTIRKNEIKATAASEASEFAKQIALNPKFDSGLYMSTFLEKVPDDQKSIYRDNFERVIKDAKKDPASFMFTYSGLGSELSQARAKGDINQEAYVMDKILKKVDINNDIVDDYTSERFYTAMKSNDPNEVYKAIHDFEYIYGDNTGRAVLDLLQRIPEDRLPKGMDDMQISMIPTLIDFSAKKDFEGFQTIMNAVKHYIDNPDDRIYDPNKLKKDYIEGKVISESEVKKMYHRNDPLSGQKRNTVIALVNKLGEDKAQEAIDMVYGDEILVGMNPVPKKSYRMDGTPIDNNAESIEKNEKKINNILAENPEYILGEENLSIIANAKSKGEDVELKVRYDSSQAGFVVVANDMPMIENDKPMKFPLGMMSEFDFNNPGSHWAEWFFGGEVLSYDTWWNTILNKREDWQ